MKEQNHLQAVRVVKNVVTGVGLPGSNFATYWLCILGRRGALCASVSSSAVKRENDVTYLLGLLQGVI